MTDRAMKNIPASVRQRLLNKAKQDRRSFNNAVVQKLSALWLSVNCIFPSL
jgi:hypothetical protein